MTEQCNDNGSLAPEWLEPQLFEKVLKETFHNYKSIKRLAVKPHLAPVENYGAVMWRIEIEVELEDSLSKSISFVLKTPHDNEQLQELMKDHDLFAIEQDVYIQIIPAFEKLYADQGVQVKFAPKTFDLPLKRPHILFENLSTRVFKNINRLEGFDAEHTKNVLKKLAQWHAASARHVATKGLFVQKYIEGYFRETSRDKMKTMFDGLNQIFLCFAKTYNNYKEYADDIHATSARMFDEFFKAGKPDPNEFNVLNHGDCWSNNIMFQYDAFGKIKDTYFVNFQTPKYGTPAQDLFYMILSSTKYDIKIKEFEHFIKFYHDQLVENLKILKYSKKIPTLSELHTMMYKYGVWGYMTVTGVMSTALMDTTHTAHTQILFGNSDSSLTLKTLMYSNDRYREHAELVLPWLKNRGALCF